jgi:hypothetical protein
LDVHGIHDARQTDALPLVLEPSSSEVEIAIELLKSPGIGKILVEVIQKRN